jgi:hypothetical protein
MEQKMACYNETSFSTTQDVHYEIKFHVQQRKTLRGEKKLGYKTKIHSL